MLYISNGSISGYVDIYDDSEMILDDSTHSQPEEHPFEFVAFEKLKNLGFEVKQVPEIGHENKSFPGHGKWVINLNTGQVKQPSSLAYFSDFRGHKW